jgi:hypothetical protein
LRLGFRLSFKLQRATQDLECHLLIQFVVSSILAAEMEPEDVDECARLSSSARVAIGVTTTNQSAPHPIGFATAPSEKVPNPIGIAQ